MANHFAGPVLNSGKPGVRKWQRHMPVGVENAYVNWTDDFVGIALDSTNDWTVIKDTSATAAIAADTANGRLAMTSAATTDNDGSSIQGNEIIALAAGRDVWFEAVLYSTDSGNAVDEQDICVGLTVNFTSDPEAMLAAADRIVFQVDDGDASILCITEKDGTATSTDSGHDIADATETKLRIRVSGTDAVYFYVGTELVATHTTNIPDDEELTMAAMQLSGSASGTKSIGVDLMSCVWTR